MIDIQYGITIIGGRDVSKALKNYKNSEWSKDFVEACIRWKRLIMVNSMQANEAPQERMSAAWRLHKRGYEPRRGSVMVKTIDATTTDRLRRSPLYLGLSPSCARKRACMELTTICRFQRLLNPSFRLFQCFQSIAPLQWTFILLVCRRLLCAIV